jgi:hypothetical protein
MSPAAKTPIAPESVRVLLAKMEALRAHCVDQIKRADEAERLLKIEREKVTRLEAEVKKLKGKKPGFYQAPASRISPDGPPAARRVEPESRA